jgi:hypothetical protein
VDADTEVRARALAGGLCAALAEWAAAAGEEQRLQEYLSGIARAADSAVIHGGIQVDPGRSST